jgi:hypothetical protein
VWCSPKQVLPSFLRPGSPEPAAAGCWLKLYFNQWSHENDWLVLSHPLSSTFHSVLATSQTFGLRVLFPSVACSSSSVKAFRIIEYLLRERTILDGNNARSPRCILRTGAFRPQWRTFQRTWWGYASQRKHCSHSFDNDARWHHHPISWSPLSNYPIIPSCVVFRTENARGVMSLSFKSSVKSRQNLPCHAHVAPSVTFAQSFPVCLNVRFQQPP